MMNQGLKRGSKWKTNSPAFELIYSSNVTQPGITTEDAFNRVTDKKTASLSVQLDMFYVNYLVKN